jgi:DNA invertase Pin-like site-specific DNA recombinase
MVYAMPMAKNATTTTLTVRAIGYRRVSTDEQTRSGAGLDAQAAKIDQLCEARGWELLNTYTDEGVSGGTAAAKRPSLSVALGVLAAGDADVLVVPKFDRLARSVTMLAGLMDLAQAQGWQLVVSDTDVDTTTASGRMMANIMGSVAEWERDIIRERTRDALQARKAAGVRLGRPVQLSQQVRDRVAELHAQGLSLRGVAAQLTADGVPTATGAQWHASTVRKVLGSLELDAQSTAAKASLAMIGA